MIPPINNNGVLPPGIYAATLDEIESRFGADSELRRVQMQSVRWMVELAKRAGAVRIVLNGSFVTAIMEPNDVDCVVLLTSEEPNNEEAFEELQQGLPFLHVTIAGQVEFDVFVNEIFAADRFRIPKGTIEVIL